MNNFIFGMFFILFSLNSFGDSLSSCTAIASVYNKNLPMVIDKVTTAESVVCQIGTPTKILMLFRINQKKSKLLVGDIKSMYTQQINTMCTTPSQRRTLESFDAEYRYVDKNGIYIASNVFTKDQCK